MRSLKWALLPYGVLKRRGNLDTDRYTRTHTHTHTHTHRGNTCKDSHVLTEVKVGVYIYKPRITDNYQKLEEGRDDFSPDLSGNMALPTA